LEKIKNYIDSTNLIVKLDGKKIYEKFPNEVLKFWRDKAVIKHYDAASLSYHIFEHSN